VLPSKVAYSCCLYSIWEKLGEWGRRAEVLCFLHELVLKEVSSVFVINKVMMNFSKKKKKK
jgi:hypothetical protein